METRICKFCNESKPIECFRLSKKKYRRWKCSTCNDKDREEWRKLNRDKDRASSKRYGDRNRVALQEAGMKRYYKNPEKSRAWALKKKYGMTLTDYANKLQAQNGGCAICGNPETVVNNGRVKDLAVDHNHDTGVIRGLLCQKHNIGIGHMDADSGIQTLLAAIEYIKKYSQ